jgi:hypothetical protein
LSHPDQIRYLHETFGTKTKPGHELASCVDTLCQDLSRCNILRVLIMPAAAELEVIVKARIDGWNEGAKETVTKEQLEGFLVWLKTPR